MEPEDFLDEDEMLDDDTSEYELPEYDGPYAGEGGIDF